MDKQEKRPDIVLVGAGIMSATLGIMLKELEPGLTIEIYERLDKVAAESSDAWNNAGTGHSAFCELNYTPEQEDGSIDITKAVKIAAQFETSKQFWAYLIDQQYVANPSNFINSIPHMSFVWGDENVTFLKKRQEALSAHHLFANMKYSDDHEQLNKWMPLVMNGRDERQHVAATRMDAGTDVNFGNLTRALFEHLKRLDGVKLNLNHEVRDIYRDERVSGDWKLKIKDLESGHKYEVHTGFAFIGAGGGALPLLEKAHIPEAKGFGGFPVSGQWLVCRNEQVIEKHQAKVYGKAGMGAPPMSVPHLDTRIIDGKKALLFGPYAGFSTRFLKHGSLMDLPKSIKLNNIVPMVSAGIHNIPLTKYLVEQVSQTLEERFDALREYCPTAVDEDWSLAVAGQRVQVIKKDEDEGGVLEFGTEIVSAADGSIAALLGASPGASTSVPIMIDVLKRCFKDKMESEDWTQKLKQMIPAYGQSLEHNASLAIDIRGQTGKTLGLHFATTLMNET